MADTKISALTAATSLADADLLPIVQSAETRKLTAALLKAYIATSTVATFLQTPSSANLLAAMTDETGTGALVFGTTPTITGGREIKTAPTITTNTLTLNCALGNVFAVSLNANITTLTFSNVPASGTAYGMTLSFTADGTARTITWGSAVKWPGGTAPTLTSTLNKVDTFTLVTWDGGTTWYAYTAGQNS
jgi:hypothetical protein